METDIKMPQDYQKQIVQHIIKNLLDIQLLRIIQAEPTWGYKIKKQVENQFSIKIRHGALYPMLNLLEEKGFVESQKQQKDGRQRKVYTITADGQSYLSTFYSVLQGKLGNEQTSSEA
ncbi:MAG: PadR family transcriptional regulator [Candidatus Bathyarchaeia archaeon]|jgi:PadR family transcriptional regulator PadR